MTGTATLNLNVVSNGASEIGKINSSLNGADKKGKSVSSSLSGITKGLKLTAVLGLGAAIANGAKEAVKFNSSFNETKKLLKTNQKIGIMENMKKDTDTSLQSMKNLENQMIDLSKATGVSADQYALGANKLAKLGYSSNTISKTLETLGKTSVVTGEGMEHLSQMVGEYVHIWNGADVGPAEAEKAMKSYATVASNAVSTTNLSMEELNMGLEYTGVAAHDAGMSMEETAAAMGVMANAGVKGSKGGTTLRSVLTNLATESGEAGRAITELGIKTRDSGGTMLPFGKILDQFKDKTKDMGNAQQVAYAKMIAGKTGVEGFMALLHSGSGTIKEMEQAFKDSQAAQEAYANSMESIQNQLNVLKSNIQAVFLKLMPLVQPIIEGIISTFTTFSNVISTIIGWIGKLGDSNKNISVLGGVFGSMIGKGIAMFAIGKVIFTIVTAMKTMLGMGTKNQSMFSALGGTMKSSISNAGMGFSTFTNTMKQTMQTMVDTIKSTMANISTTISDGFKNALNVNENVPNPLDKLAISTTVAMNTVKASVGTGMNGVKATIISSFNGIKSAPATAFAAIKNGANTAFNAIKSAPSTALNGIKTGFNGMKSAGANAFKAMGKASKVAFKNMAKVGKASLKGLGSMASGVGKGIGKAFSGIGGIMKKAFSFGGLSVIIGFVTQLIQKTVGFEAVLKTIQPIIDVLKQAFGTLVQAFSTAFGSMGASAEGAGGGIKGVIQGILDAAGPIIGQIAETISGLIPIILPIVTQIATTMGDLFRNIGPVISDVFATIGPVIADFFSQIGPIIQELMPTIQELISQLGDTFKEIMPIIGDVLKQLAPIFADLLKTMAPLIAELVTKLAPVIGEIMTLLAEVIAQILPPIMEVISALLPPIMEIVNVLMEVIAAILPPIIELIDQLLPPIMEIIDAVLPPIIDLINTLIPPIMSIIKAILPPLISIIKFLANIIKIVLIVVINIIVGVIKTWIKIWETIIGVFKTVFKWIGDKLSPIFDSLKKGLTKIKDFVGGAFTKAWEGLKSLFNKVMGWIQPLLDAFKKAGEWIASLFGGGDGGKKAADAQKRINKAKEDEKKGKKGKNGKSGKSYSFVRMGDMRRGMGIGNLQGRSYSTTNNSNTSVYNSTANNVINVNSIQEAKEFVGDHDSFINRMTGKRV